MRRKTENTGVIGENEGNLPEEEREEQKKKREFL